MRGIVICISLENKNASSEMISTKIVLSLWRSFLLRSRNPTTTTANVIWFQFLALLLAIFTKRFFLGCRIFKYDEVYNFLAKKVAKFCNDTQTEHGRRNVKKYW